MQKAAKESRFRDIVKMLSEAVDAGELTPEEVIIANRGIAYSLLNANGLKVAWVSPTNFEYLT